MRNTLDEVKASGQNVVRVFAFVDVEAGTSYDSAFSALYKNSTGQPAVREEVLRGLDYILDEVRPPSVLLKPCEWPTGPILSPIPGSNPVAAASTVPLKVAATVLVPS